MIALPSGQHDRPHGLKRLFPDVRQLGNNPRADQRSSVEYPGANQGHAEVVGLAKLFILFLATPAGAWWRRYYFDDLTVHQTKGKEMARLSVGHVTILKTTSTIDFTTYFVTC
nr:hypothetical protein BgiMline_003987 [Biomphalaria glabrata]